MSTEQTWTHGLEGALEEADTWAEAPGRKMPRAAEASEGQFPIPEPGFEAAVGELDLPGFPTAEHRQAFAFFIETLCRGDRICLKRLLDTLERMIIIRTLNRCRGNQRTASAMLGLKYTTLNEKVKKHGLRFSKNVQAGKGWTAI